MKTAVILFGRFNPPTRGHQELIESYALPYAKKHKAECIVFITHTEDADNPLTYNEKRSIIHARFPTLRIGDENVRTLFDALHVTATTHKHIFLICGKDRSDEFKTMVREWNQKHPSIHVTVVSTPRNEDAVSGHLLRQAARDGDVDTVKKLSMKTTNPSALIRIIQKRSTTMNEEHMTFKSYAQWVSEAKDDEFTPLDTPGQNSSPKKKPKDEPQPTDTDEAEPTDEPDESPDESDEDTPSQPAPKLSKPLPADATEDDGRVPSDTPKNQSKLVIHPDIRMKYKMKEKAKRLVSGDKTERLNKNSRVGVGHYI